MMAERWSGGIAAGYSDSEFARRALGGARRSCRLRLGWVARAFCLLKKRRAARLCFAPSGFFDAGLEWTTVTRYRSATVAGSHGLPRPQRSPAHILGKRAVDVRKNAVSLRKEHALAKNISTYKNVLICIYCQRQTIQLAQPRNDMRNPPSRVSTTCTNPARIE
jgi:hypothetical protein